MLRTPVLILLAVASSLAFAQSKKATPVSAAALDNRAATLDRAGKFPEAFALYLRAANMGDPTAERAVGEMYLHGTGVAQDSAQAVNWLQKAGDKYDVLAEVDLAVLYHFGSVVPHDEEKAFDWFNKAANSGTPYGEVEFAEQLTARHEYTSAMFWYRKAAAQRDEYAMRRIAYLYENGYGVNLDKAQAAMWYQKAIAINPNDTEAKAALAQLQNLPSSSPTNTYTRQSTTAPPTPQKGTCAFVYTGEPTDPNGTEYAWGAAWSRNTLEEAQAAAHSAVYEHSNGAPIDPHDFRSITSGCSFAHGAVAGKLKTQWQTGALLGPGMYDVVTANLAATTNDAVNTAMADCQNTKGLGGDNEVCEVLARW